MKDGNVEIGQESPAPRAIAGGVAKVAAEVAAVVKPKMRGWLHAGTFPLAVAAGIVIVILAPNEKAGIASAIFSITAALLFGVSAARPETSPIASQRSPCWVSICSRDLGDGSAE